MYTRAFPTDAVMRELDGKPLGIIELAARLRGRGVVGVKRSWFWWLGGGARYIRSKDVEDLLARQYST